MATNDDEDITRIEDLPNLDRSEEDEDFTDIEMMAKKMGLEETEQSSEKLADEDDAYSALDKALDEQLPDLPPSEASEEEISENSYGQEEDFNTFDDFSSPVQETEDFNQDSISDNQFANFDDESSQEPFANSQIKDLDHETTQNDIFENTTNEILQEDLNPIEQNEKTSSQLISQEELKDDDNDLESLSTHPEKKTLIEDQPLNEWKQPTEFEDIKSFAESISYGDFNAEGNPPFSLIIKNPKYYEDLNEIIEILIEFGIYKNEQKEQLITNLKRGQMLLPRLSEYAAITIAHKLRAFDIEILLGLTEEVNPPRTYQSNDRGLTSKASVYNNKSYFWGSHQSKSSKDILISTLPTIEDYSIQGHLGVATYALQISKDELINEGLEERIMDHISADEKEKVNDLRLKRENLLAAKSSYHNIDDIYKSKVKDKTGSLKLDDLYQEVVDGLKQKALTKKANAIVGLNFSIIPLSLDTYIKEGPRYQILGTGNLVWIEKK